MRENEPIGVEERELDDLTLEALAEAHAVRPPKALRGAVLAAARAEAQASALARSRRRWRVVGAVAATAVLVMAGLLGRATQRLGTTSQQLAAKTQQLAALSNDFAALEGQLASERRRLVSLQEAVESQAQFLRVLDGVRLRSASLAPTEGRPGRARVLLDVDSGEAAVVLAGVPALEPGKTYELWAIRGTKAPEPAGLLGVADAGGAALRVEPLKAPGEVTAFAVSIEPAGGSPSPTGPVVLVGGVV
jgi:anti-sigma-K factor RskA